MEKVIDWLCQHLPKVENLPLIKLKELNDHDIGFEDAQQITKGELYEKDVTDGEFNPDIDDVEQVEFKVAKTLYVIQDNSKSSTYKPVFLFSFLDEDEAQETFIILAQKKLDTINLNEFQRLFPSYFERT